MHLFHIPECSIQNRNVPISVLNGAFWDMEQVHSGICKIGLVEWHHLIETLWHIYTNRLGHNWFRWQCQAINWASSDLPSRRPSQEHISVKFSSKFKITEIVVVKMTAILFRPQCIEAYIPGVIKVSVAHQNEKKKTQVSFMAHTITSLSHNMGCYRSVLNKIWLR